MTARPSRDELLGRIRELEAENAALRSARDELLHKEALHREVQEMALLGHWELDLVTDTLYWSDEIYRIFEMPADQFGATYEAFLETVHPDDRAFVNAAYASSVKNRTPYDIVHRLLLRDGSLKYVNEKCKTEYGPEGEPVRSVGTVQDITAQMVSEDGFRGIISRDARMQETFDTIRELAQHKVPVLIQGESGTGKELVARAIHDEGPRATAPFVPVNCGALPEGLLESELFGHVRGAFTGAIKDKKGRFELADGGTLFLDEVADLPKMLQVKLLRALQEGTFERVGGEKTIQVDVRLISAANVSLAQAVQKGDFREDLYYRLKVVPIELPALRERKTDIALLTQHFMEKASKEGYRTEGLSKAALAQMMDYAWPGNVRELQSMVHYALIKAKGETIRPRHLPAELHAVAAPRSPFDTGQERSVAAAGLDAEPGPADLAAETFSSLRAGRRNKLDELAVRAALKAANGNKVRAAKLLGVGRATLYRFLSKHPL